MEREEKKKKNGKLDISYEIIKVKLDVLIKSNPITNHSEHAVH